jgi:D-sedoheptulose 7-phosphate isomerase
MSTIQLDFDRYQDVINSIDLDWVKRIAKLMLDQDQIIFAGNGGSYGNATHMAGDMLINSCLRSVVHTIGDNLVAFSALSNDVSYEEAMAKEYLRRVIPKYPSMVLLLSTSGKSKNIIRLSEAARAQGSKIVAITGRQPSEALLTDHIMKLNSTEAGLIESAYDLIGHLLIMEINRLG